MEDDQLRLTWLLPPLALKLLGDDGGCTPISTFTPDSAVNTWGTVFPVITSVNTKMSASISVSTSSFHTLKVTVCPSINPLPLPSSFDVAIWAPGVNPSSGTV